MRSASSENNTASTLARHSSSTASPSTQYTWFTDGGREAKTAYVGSMRACAHWGRQVAEAGNSWRLNHNTHLEPAPTMCVAPLHFGVCLGILGVVQAVAWAAHWIKSDRFEPPQPLRLHVWYGYCAYASDGRVSDHA